MEGSDHLKGKWQSCFFLISVHSLCKCVRGMVASWLVRLTPEWVVWVRALARDIVLCPWTRHFTLTVPLSSQVYEWVVANLILGVALGGDGLASHSGGVEILLVASCYWNQDKLWPDEPLGSYPDFTYLPLCECIVKDVLALKIWLEKKKSSLCRLG